MSNGLLKETIGLLSAQLPFTAKTPTGVAIKHVTEAPKPLRELRPDLPAAVEAVVLHALEKKLEARPASALALARAFAGAVPADVGASAVLHVVAGESAAPVKPSVPTLIDDKAATNLLPQSRDTNPQQRATGSQAVSYETTTGAAVRAPQAEAVAEPALPSSAGLDTQRLAAQVKADVVSDNSPGAVLARLRSQPLLLGVLGVLLLALFGWWLMSGPPHETETARTIATPVPAATVENAAATPAPTPGPAVIEDMVYVPGGALLLNANSDGKCPTVPVTIKPFYLDKTEVTNGEYQLYLAANSAAPPPSWKGGLFPPGAEKLPVTDVSWEEAENYARWAQKRLPTEAEWEFAARGANDAPYPWGNEWRADYANVAGKQLLPVGSFAQAGGQFGAFDLIGNAAEWTASDFNACAKAEESVKSDAGNKVVRGGSFESTAKDATASARQSFPAKRQGNMSFKAVGFRCALDVR